MSLFSPPRVRCSERLPRQCGRDHVHRCWLHEGHEDQFDAPHTCKECGTQWGRFADYDVA